MHDKVDYVCFTFKKKVFGLRLQFRPFFEHVSTHEKLALQEVKI